MARLGRILPAVVVTSGNPDSVNDSPVTTTTVGGAYDLSGQLGAVLRTADGKAEYIYVKFSSTSTGKTPAAGQLCYWLSSTSTTLDPSWVVDNNTTASNASQFDPAGVVRVAATRGNYVWLLRKHPACAIASTSTVGIYGDAVVTSSSSGEPTVIASTSTVLPAGGIGTTPWGGGPGGAGFVGYLVSSSTAMPSFVATTATGALGVNLPVRLFIN